jgi:hypothetical protein
MRTYLLLAVGLALASCTTTKPKSLPPAEPIGLDTAPPTDLGTTPPKMVVARPASVFDKLLGRTPKPWVVQPITAHRAPDIGNGPVPRKCKGCVFNQVAGNQTNAGKKATATAGDDASVLQAGKKAGPVVLADSGATVQVATSGKGQAAAAGKDVSQQQTTTKAGLPWARIVMGAVGGGFLIWVLFFGGGGVLLALWRKNKPADTTA